ncbi:cadherin-1-like [Boleophthalmus pectinirostris]|uniref:cadherin-1-like n=1 Tax=Boleophthalmus pectinirostris TaxID=150288 RepID=UPI002431E4D5|nr:cadherin-1-like [Boleophthalmus pectinirostris]
MFLRVLLQSLWCWVALSDCSDHRRFVFSSEDSRFSVQTDGAITVKRHVVLHEGHKDYSVHAWDKVTTSTRVQHQGHHQHNWDHGHHQGNHEKHHQHGHQTESPAVAVVAVEDAPSPHKRESLEEDVVIYFPKATKGLKRRKRDWVIPNINVPENDRGPFPKKVSQIRSSDDRDRVIYYSITGPGANLPPVHLFTMDKYTGILYVTRPLDREVQSHYTFEAHAVAEGAGQAETMELKVIVIDQNDNRPVFHKDTYVGEVAESSPLNFEILQVTATDADQPGTLNADLRYRIIDQEPKSPAPDMFTINSITGFIRVNARGLDREKNPKYTLEIDAADMVGEGLIGRTKVILTVTDSNDNPPIYTESQFTATLPENKEGALVAKMLVTDQDEAHTSTWNAKFTIVDGNQNGLFAVATGVNKQEGIITTAKGLDFEKTQRHKLLVAVENEVPFAVPLPTSTATVFITVTDINEVPIFESVLKKVSQPEDLAVDQKVVLYTAYDPDTARNQTVMYRIVSDPAGWLNVAKDTGLVTVKSPMDRESSFVKEGDIYTALIGAYDDDEVPATGTGTLEIQLISVNDNVPSIKDGSFTVNITDKDGPGFVNWTTHVNDTNLVLNRPIISVSVSDGASELQPQGVRVQLGSKFRVKCSVEPQYPGGSFRLLSPAAPPAQNRTLPAVNHSAHFLFSDADHAHKGNYTCVYLLQVFDHNFSSQSHTLQLSVGESDSDLIIRVVVILLLKLLYILPMSYYYCKVRARGGARERLQLRVRRVQI